MVMILSGMAAAVVALRRLWQWRTRADPTLSVQTSQNVKLSTNLLIVIAQAVGYVVELLSGARSAPPGTKTPDAVATQPGPFLRPAQLTPLAG